MKDFFVSYNKADKNWAEWIAWQLEEAGYSTVLQAWDFGAGSNFVLEMQKAAREAERTVAVLSPDYLASRFTQPEWAAAFAQDPTGEKRLLVPIRVRECDLKGLLGPIVDIDLVHLDEGAAKASLLAEVKRERGEPAVAPCFPVKAETPRFPGALPGIWNVPHRRNPNFTGREELLESLRAALTSDRTAAVTQAISGLGGVGKTQLAVEYAYRHTADYSTVWWVRAEEASTRASDLAGLAVKLGVAEKDARDVRTLLRMALRRDGRRQRRGRSTRLSHSRIRMWLRGAGRGGCCLTRSQRQATGNAAASRWRQPGDSSTRPEGTYNCVRKWTKRRELLDGRS
jgi:hypothetical protein